MQRLLLHDYAVETSDRWTWYGATPQKLAVFDALGFDRDLLPAYDYPGKGPAGGVTRRYFVDHLPLGVASWKLCFPFVFFEDRTVDAARFRLKQYRRLWAALRSMGLWVQVVVVGVRGDGGDWRRRLGDYVAPPGGGDRARLADTVERYLIERFEADGCGPVLRAYGGAAGARARARELERGPGPAEGARGAMAVEVWLSERLSTGAWAAGVPPGARMGVG